MTNLNYVNLDNRRVLEISGDDARDFLQGLVSNDLERVSPTSAIHAALLTPQGKYLHDFFILEMNGKLYLDCEAARLDDLYKRLRMFKLRAKVELEIIDDLTVVALFGDGAAPALGLESKAGLAVERDNGAIYIDPRLSAIGARAMLPKETIDKILSDVGFAKADFKSYDNLRLSLGLPDSSRDLQIDKSILLESGFEELNGVDFDKGCYVGQELTARTKHRGLIKKRLIPVEYDGPALAAGTEITQGGKNAGELRSSLITDDHGIGLALLRLEALDNTEPLMADGTPLTPNKPAWVNF
ncbi:MAG: folate-binding protein YgfZ [Rhodospirillaceae bacterium]|jgi:tRNA-modifying protein YgfZ|nr:folate-binding protein YgfZ [Rhodospirillaceae bacterium]